MALENVISTVLSNDFLFGAATALAFRKQVAALFGSVLGSASDAADGGDEQN
jgi:hypothetical protein